MMEAQYIALSTAMKDLLPMRDLLREICGAMGLDYEELSTIQSTVWEDNVSTLTLVNLEPPIMTLRSKHFAVKYHWFCEKLI